MSKPKAQAVEIPSRGWIGVLFAVVFTALSVLAAYLIQVATVVSGLSADIERICATSRFLDQDIALRADYTNTVLDRAIGTLIAAFMAGPTGWDAGFQVQMAYFLVSFFAIIALWSIESVRRRNALAYTSFTTLWALFYQTVGGAIIIPLYYLVYLYESRGTKSWTTAQRAVPLPKAKALLPALVIGYLMPTLAMFLPDADPEYKTTQFLIFCWQFTPLYANLILVLLPRIFSTGGKDVQQGDSSGTRDVAYLDRVYKVVFVTTALAHFAFAYVIFTSSEPRHSFTHVMLKPHDWGQSGVTKGLHAVFQVDYWIIFLASLLWAYLAVWDLKRGGKTKVSLATTAAAMVLGSVVVGPAATTAAVWYWREHAMLVPDVYTP